MTRYCLIGPTYPYRGGIAHYTTLLAQHLREAHEVLLLSFSRQYPAWLFPGRSDKDPSERPLQTEAHYLLDPLNPLTWWRTLRQLRQWQPDVVIIPWWHPYFAPVWSILSRAIKHMSFQPKLIFICHNILPHEEGRITKWLMSSLIRFTLGKGDRFIVHSQSDKQILHRFLPEATVTVTPHPTYAALGDVPPTPLMVTLPDDCPLLLFCGFVRPYKGLDILLDALAIALRKRPLHLLVAGEFWQGSLAQYQTQIANLGLAKHVTILDEYLPNELLATCIDRAGVVVLPYRTATQSGIIQLAFGRQTPVITTDVGGLGEVVVNGCTGFVVPSEDPAALAQAIEDYFANDLEGVFSENIVGGNGRFSWAHVINHLN